MHWYTWRRQMELDPWTLRRLLRRTKYYKRHVIRCDPLTERTNALLRQGSMTIIQTFWSTELDRPSARIFAA